MFKKRLPNRFVVFAIVTLLIFVSCKKEKMGIDGLPPITQSGKQTFGCLVNGILFTPKTRLFSYTPALDANYSFWNNSYILMISANRQTNDNLFSVTINIVGIPIKEGMKIPLTKGNIGEGVGSYVDYKSDFIGFETNNQFKGELFITRFDEVNHIISGTFWFDGQNSKGEKVEIREGRFDIKDERI